MTITADSKWTERGQTDEFLDFWRRNAGSGVHPPRIYELGDLIALVGHEPVDKGDPRWHISVRAKDRVPSWEELVFAAHSLRPGVVFVLGVPPRSWWMNVHPFVLHLWETNDVKLIGQWRFEARGDAPS
jgi:hypothetical protein